MARTQSTRSQTRGAEEAKSLLSTLEAGVTELVTSEDWARWLDQQARFHSYSFYNCHLIAWQCPEASRVAGYKTWQALGRQVRAGEKSIRILAPSKFKTTGEDGVEQWAIRGFHTVGVFDISQTEGDELPEVCNRLTGAAPADLFESLTSVAGGLGFRVDLRDIPGSTNGYCDVDEHLIAVERSNDPAQQAKTLIHELAHAILHAGEGASVERPVKELEAESTAYVVAQALGFDTSAYTFGYVAGWAGRDVSGKELVERIRRSGDRIHTASKQILEALEDASTLHDKEVTA
jgi:antirestriction protein ArdC